MKKGFLIVLFPFWTSLFLLSPVFAGFELPYEVYRIDELKEAQKRARSIKQPIVFLYSDEETNCGLTTAASLDVFEEFKDSHIIIYVDKTVWAKIPALVKKAVNSSESGTFIPKSIVVDPEITRVISVIPYKRDPDERLELLRAAKEMSLR